MLPLKYIIFWRNKKEVMLMHFKFVDGNVAPRIFEQWDFLSVTLLPSPQQSPIRTTSRFILLDVSMLFDHRQI